MSTIFSQPLNTVQKYPIFQTVDILTHMHMHTHTHTGRMELNKDFLSGQTARWQIIYNVFVISFITILPSRQVSISSCWKQIESPLGVLLFLQMCCTSPRETQKGHSPFLHFPGIFLLLAYLPFSLEYSLLSEWCQKQSLNEKISYRQLKYLRFS